MKSAWISTQPARQKIKVGDDPYQDDHEDERDLLSWRQCSDRLVTDRKIKCG
jgi:hypothetical protein